ELEHRHLAFGEVAVDLRLGDVGGGVGVEDVAGAAVGLIAGDETVRVAPVGPAADVGGGQVADGLAVVALDTGDRAGRTVPEEGRQLLAQVIAAKLLKLGQEVRRPLSVVILIGVVKLAAGLRAPEFGERLVEVGKIAVETWDRERVEDVAEAAGCGPF